MLFHMIFKTETESSFQPILKQYLKVKFKEDHKYVK